MSHKTRIATIPVTLGAVLAFVACGNSSELTDDEGVGGSSAGSSSPGSGGTPPGTGGTPPATGGTSAGTSSAGTGSGGMPPSSCSDVDNQQFDTRFMPGDKEPHDPRAKQTLDQMSQEQKILQMQGVPTPAMPDYRDIERSQDTQVGDLKIRGWRYRDAAHGVNLDAGQDNRPDGMNHATAFPQSSARGASWDLDLEYRLGEAMGDETVASKNNMLLGPCMNIIRHPYWGRTQETYSEDSYHIGRMASAFTAGLQTYVSACAKHFAANNVERLRSSQDAIMDEQTLREIYGRHFEMVVRDGGVSCIMASYNKINGKKSTQNAHLLTEILRNDMGFRGLVISDWWAMPGDQGGSTHTIPTSEAFANTVEAALAGMDIEVPWTLTYNQLGPAAADPTVGADVSRAIDTSALRVLQQKYRFNSAIGDGQSGDPWGKKPAKTRLDSSGINIEPYQDHFDLAEEAAYKSAVLLKNGGATPVLPLTGTPSIAVIGQNVQFSLIDTSYPASGNDFDFATEVAVGDRGSSRVNADPANSIGPFAGIQTIAGTHGVTAVTTAATGAAATGDVMVVVVGMTPGDEGEEYAIAAGGDRTTLDLPHGQNELVGEVLALNKPTVIIIQSGSIVNLPWLSHANQQQATIWAGYSGMRAGLAYGKLLFGDVNFSGKMPMAWPTKEQQDVQAFKDMELSTAMGYFFGYREYDRRGEQAQLVFPFGHGLSYTTFEYSGLTSPCETPTEKAIFNFTIDVKNTGTKDGEEVVQLYVKGPAAVSTTSGAARPVKELKSFAKVNVAMGQTVKANLPLRIQDLRHWQGGADGSWVIDKGMYTVMVGKNAADAEAGTNKVTFTIN